MTRRTGADGTGRDRGRATTVRCGNAPSATVVPGTAAAHNEPVTDAPAATVPGTTLGTEWVHRLLDAARSRLGMDVAWFSVFTDDQQEITAATGDLEAMDVSEGMTAPLAESFCVRVLAGQLPPVVTGAGRDARTRDLGATQRFGIGSYVGAPVRATDGRPVGMLCCLGRSDGAQLGAESVRTVELIADLIGLHLDGSAAAGPAPVPPAAADDRGRRVREVLDRGTVVTLLQPVVDMTTGAVVSQEALTRFPEARDGGPAALFADAAAVGLGPELELLAARRALEAARRLPPEMPVAVNLSAGALLRPAVVDLLLDHRDAGIAVELTEHERIDDYTAVVATTEALRRAGIRLAVDDAGAGYASMRHILRLRPDVIKLDIALVAGVHTDPAKQAMLSAMVAFAADTGADLVAEGIEEPEERDALLARGIRYGQGYLLGPPAPPPGLL
jgi:EAL domain-containing protein (putative c-di-GMP-specific phosphodiesterase class I)